MLIGLLWGKTSVKSIGRLCTEDQRGIYFAKIIEMVYVLFYPENRLRDRALKVKLVRAMKGNKGNDTGLQFTRGKGP